MNSVLVFGSINHDTIVSTPRRPQAGETLLGHSVTTQPGGKGANQAVAAARLGARVKMFGSVGADAAGSMMVDSLANEGVDVVGVLRAQVETGAAILTVSDDGENSIIVIPGANKHVGEWQVQELETTVKPGDVVVFQLEIPLAIIAPALKVAQDGNARTILNAAPAHEITSLLPQVDILVVNETEAELLGGYPVASVAEAQRAAANFANAYEVVAIVTLGSLGSVVAEGENLLHIPAVSVDAVDTTGAGDTFVGALAAFLADGMSIAEAAHMASRAGAIACVALGAQASMPTRAALL
ncbi:ribokinase [Specibacter sp. NPDC078709]|uniref:ribokinase n=1 Tax=Specibacter sp. NPDC078709 TaxID=3154364 RepID=UPI003430FEDE